MNVKDLKIMFLPTKIYTADKKLLYGSAVFSPIKMLKLKKRNVTQVIDLRDKEKISTRILKKIEEFYCKIFGINYKNINFYVSTKTVPAQDFFDNLNTNIQNTSGKAYMHCHYGSHRTNLGVAMYEKIKGKNNNDIRTKLIENFWKGESEKTRNNSKNRKTLEVFLSKYFPDN